MARLVDERILRLIQEALAEWNCDGFIVWKRRPAEWLEANIEDRSTRSVGQLLHDFVAQSGAIDQVREQRPEYASLYEYHYDFRLSIDGRKVYVETVLNETRTGPTITIVSMHDE